MIDGVKFTVPIATAQQWQRNPYLKFHFKQEAEICNEYGGRFYLAKFKGLQFLIFVNKDTNAVIGCEVRGSLHKYFNNGKHNANDFTPDDLESVLQDLEANFNIDLNTAILHNLEVGVNIYTPIPTSEILLNIVAYKNNEFIPIRANRKTIGKAIEQQRQTLKIYDKGKQYKDKATKDHPKNLTRFEVKFEKMAGVHDCINSLYKKRIIQDKYTIKTLLDLTDTDKISPLIATLLDKWNDTIYYDKSINLKDLTSKNARRVLYSATPRNWIEFNRTQRSRAKKRFNELMRLYGSTTQSDIYVLILEKWQHLTGKKCTRFNQGFKEKEQRKSVHVLTDIIHRSNVYNYTHKENTHNKENIATKNINNNPLKNNNKNTPHDIKHKKNTTKKTKCKKCQKSLREKKRGAKFCSLQCKNKYHGKKRTKINRMKREKEKKIKKNLIGKIKKSDLTLLIVYKSEDGLTIAERFYQHEIQPPPKWIRRIKKVLIMNDKTRPPLELTTVRAKQFIRAITKLNKLKNTK